MKDVKIKMNKIRAALLGLSIFALTGCGNYPDYNLKVTKPKIASFSSSFGGAMQEMHVEVDSLYNLTTGEAVSPACLRFEFAGSDMQAEEWRDRLCDKVRKAQRENSLIYISNARPGSIPNELRYKFDGPVYLIRNPEEDAVNIDK